MQCCKLMHIGLESYSYKLEL
uniref:Uncharacterized protein n=1 Tax=Rhizophora mucronata TaxID=61149 RepID=A0A2P2NAV5_RHIMU